MSKAPRFPAIALGPLPVAKINGALGTELEPGDVLMSARAHRHIAIDHATDYAICITALPGSIAHPTYVGQAPGHADNFEMIRRIGLPDGRAVLVAIGLERDGMGFYRVKSCYLTPASRVEARRRAGRLTVVLP